MPGVTAHTPVARWHCDRRDVDTDQIIPASWLKRVERTGFGAGLFGAWREDPGLRAEPARRGRGQGARRRGQLRLRLVA